MRVRVAASILVLVCACAAPAAAQSSTGRIGGRVFGWGDWQQLSAKESFDAVTGETTTSGGGGGLEVHRLWRGAFVRGAVSRLSMEGERIFVFDGTVFPLGQPLSITMTPIEVAAGWRFNPIARRFTPYVGAGALWVKYREESGSLPSDDVNETYSGAVLFGGFDANIWRALSAGAEVGWRTAKVPDPGGAFEAFREDDLGGVSFRLMLSIGR